MIKRLIINTFLFAVFGILLALPFLPSKLLKYYPQKNVLSAVARNDQTLIKILPAGDMLQMVAVTAFPQQFAYYERILEVRNFSGRDMLYKAAVFVNFVNGKNTQAEVEAVFNNNSHEIVLHPGEKAYTGLKVLGRGDKVEKVEVFLNISAKDVQK